MHSHHNTYDIIIIGSGMGAMTVGSLMSQLKNKKVLLLEQHYVLGGFTHVFKREKGYHWDVGIHYVGDLQEGHQFKTLFDFATQGGVRWKKMPYIFDKFVFPDFTFEAPSSQYEFRNKLVEQFPHEEKAIDQYFKDVIEADGWYRKNIIYKHLPSILKWVMKPSAKQTALATMSTRDYMDSHFTDRKLKGLLVSQWGNYGAVPGKSSFTNHAMVVRHFYNGGYYPIGSSKTIAESMIPIIEKAGGQALVNHEVKEIIIRDGEAVGVKVDIKHGKKRNEEIFYAPVIISSAGAYNTYCKLIPEMYAKELRHEVKHHPDGLAHVCLYLGFHTSPETLGFKGENHWIFDEYDHDEIFEDLDALASDRMKMAFLSFPSLKDPESKAHTGEIITFVSYELFEKWKNERWKKRGDEYEDFKEVLAQRMLDYIEKKYPGFRSIVDFYELSTPLSTEHFTMHPKGEIYGRLTTPDRMLKKWNQVKTPIKNLYITGTDAAVLGVAGAFTGGIFTTIQLLGGSLGVFSYLGLMSKANKYQQKLKSEGKKTVFD
jgi:all-trans-retinol 13,14-reductase